MRRSSRKMSLHMRVPWTKMRSGCLINSKRRQSEKIKKHWAKGETVEFIIQRQEYDCLWDVSKQAYSSRNSKDKVFEGMARKCNCSITNVRKERKILQSGDCEEDVKNSEWEHWEVLQFMLQTITLGKSIANFQVTDTRDVAQDDTKTMTPRNRTPRRTPKVKLNKVNMFVEKRCQALASCVNMPIVSM